MKIYYPKEGDTRIIKKFALFPISTSYNDETIWFEFVYVKQRYSYINGWRNVCFVDDNEYHRYIEFHRKTKRYW